MKNKVKYDLEKRIFVFDTDMNKLTNITNEKFEIKKEDGVKTLYLNNEIFGGIFEKDIEISKPFLGVIDRYILITRLY